MQISNNIQTDSNSLSRPGVSAGRVDPALMPRDRVEKGQDNVLLKAGLKVDNCRKLFGTAGATAGAISGRVTVSLLFPLCAGVSASVLCGPLGPFVAGAVGLAATAASLIAFSKVEERHKLGALTGGITGGIFGSLTGIMAGAIPGFKPPADLLKETRGFSILTLPEKIFNPIYSSHKRITPEEAKEMASIVKPGDIIVTNCDDGYEMGLMQKIMGKSGNWTHTAIATGEGTVVEMLADPEGVFENDIVYMLCRDQHAKIVRPRYRDEESINRVIAEARDKIGKAKYNKAFDLKDENNFYCTSLVYKTLQKASPEVKVDTFKVLGKDFVNADQFIDSPDTDEVFSTKSDFWANLMSKFA